MAQQTLYVRVKHVMTVDKLEMEFNVNQPRFT